MDPQTVEIKDTRTDKERKDALIRQGEFYRIGVVQCKAQVKQAARPEALFRSAIDHATWSLRAKLDRLLKPSGASVATMLPFALKILQYVRHRRMGKAALGAATVLGAAGAYLQYRRTHPRTTAY
jgi:hypothetical protein